MQPDGALAVNSQHRQPDRSVIALRREALGYDARDVLAGRIDDATVRQAVEVRDDA